jgi:steroid 5-alpha reductase family enzyme
MIVASLVLSDMSLSQLQKSTLRTLIIICGCSMAYCFIVGEITRNNSQMDKLWSILPIAYAWVIAVNSGFKTRVTVYAMVVSIWGIRLTVNFARKGAYSIRFWTGEEDYRWSILRQKPAFSNKVVWALFDLFFISFYQNALVLAICLPALAVMESSVVFSYPDAIALIFAVAFLLLETVADEYQWLYHQTKKKYMKEYGSLDKLPEPFNLGFNTLGPWKRMRHPNYLGEQGIWMSLYFFAIGAGVARYGIFHWTMVGPLLLILLFMGSSTLGEKISSKKYPRYKDYIDQVYKYLPIHSFKG